MVLKSLDSSFSGIPDMNMHRMKLIRDILLRESFIEDTTGFIVHDLDLGLMYSSCERVKEFLDTFFYECA